MWVEEAELDQAALASQRSINHIRIGETTRSCLVVPAPADGDCGFHAINTALQLLGHEKLAKQINRLSFIHLIAQLWENNSLTDKQKTLIEKIFQADKSPTDHRPWTERFKSSGYWLQEEHFRLLSHRFNLRFNFYTLDPSRPQFVPELSNETIYEASDETTALTISLAHLSTRCLDQVVAALNHYEAILIEPTVEQQTAAKMNKALPSAQHPSSSTWSMFEKAQSLCFPGMLTVSASAHGVSPIANRIHGSANTMHLDPTMHRDETLSSFQVPPVNLHFVGRSDQLCELAQQLYTRHLGVVGQSILGLGGVGKTQLAMRYAHLAIKGETLNGIKLNYSKVIWLRAQNLELFFTQLAFELDVNSTDLKQLELSKEVYRLLISKYSQPMLLIFDDASDYDSIKFFLPQDYTSQEHCHILITSRNQAWGSDSNDSVKSISLGDFTFAESIEYIQKRLPKATEDEAKDLAALLHYFPLALAQAVAYIQKSPGFHITKYIEFYQEHEKYRRELLESEIPELAGQLEEDPRKRAVYTTWTISLEKIKESTEIHASLAEQLLYLSAYLAPNHIPVQLLQTAIGCPEENLQEVLLLLNHYSLIHLEEDLKSLNMHQMLQEILYLQQNYQQRQNRISLLLKKIILIISESNDSWCLKQANSLPHLDCLLEHVWHLPQQLEEDFFTMLLTGVAILTTLSTQAYLYSTVKHWQKLLERMHGFEHRTETMRDLKALTLVGSAYAYRLLGGAANVQQAKNYFEEALALWRTQSGAKHSDMALVLNNLGMLLQSSIGAANIREAKNYFEEVLTLSRTQPVADYSNVAVALALSSLGLVYQKLGGAANLQHAKNYFEEALALEKTQLITEHSYVAFVLNIGAASSLNNLGLVYQKLGGAANLQQAKNYFEEALALMRTQLGAEHRSMAMTLTNLGAVCQELGGETNLQQAKDYLEEALTLWRTQQHGAEHTNVALALSNLGAVCRKLGGAANLRQAKICLEEAIALLKKHPASPISVVKHLGELTEITLLLGDEDNRQLGIRCLEERLHLLEDQFGKEHVNVKVAEMELNLIKHLAVNHSADDIRGLIGFARQIVDSSQEMSSLAQYLNSIMPIETPPELIEDLCFACMTGDLAEVKRLLPQISNIDEAVDIRKRTVLHWAIIKEQAVIARLLISANARLDLEDTAGKTAMDYAYESENPEIMAIFADREEWLNYLLEATLRELGEDSDNIDASLNTVQLTGDKQEVLLRETAESILFSAGLFVNRASLFGDQLNNTGAGASDDLATAKPR